MTKLTKKDAVEMMANAQTIALKRYQSAVLMTPDLEGLAKETAALQEVLNTTDEVVRYIAQYMPDDDAPSAVQDEVKKEPETWYSDNNGRVAIGTNDDGTTFVHYFPKGVSAKDKQLQEAYGSINKLEEIAHGLVKKCYEFLGDLRATGAINEAIYQSRMLYLGVALSRITQLTTETEAEQE